MPQHHDKPLTHKMGDDPELRRALNKAKRRARKENKMTNQQQTTDNNSDSRPVQMRQGQMNELKSEIRSAVNEAVGDELGQLNAKIESETSKMSLEDKLDDGRLLAKTGTWVKRLIPFGEHVNDVVNIGVKAQFVATVGYLAYTGIKGLISGDPSEAVEAVVEAAVE